MKKFLPLIIVFLFVISCRPETHTPKPRGYYHIDLPKHSYQSFDSSGFPYAFEYPEYADIIYNPTFYGEKPENPYWINIDFPSIGGKIYLSYKPINTDKNLFTLNEDMYRMTFTAHDKKADYIEDYYFKDTVRDVYGIFYNVSGDAASAYQFYATDSTSHFIRGALYFDVAPNADSLQPLNDFLKDDINHMLKTLEWK